MICLDQFLACLLVEPILGRLPKCYHEDSSRLLVYRDVFKSHRTCREANSPLGLSRHRKWCEADEDQSGQLRIIEADEYDQYGYSATSRGGERLGLPAELEPFPFRE